MTSADVGMQDLSAIADTGARVVHLPAIATQDWCETAAEVLLAVRRSSAVVVTIADLPVREGGTADFRVEATGGASGLSGIGADALARIHTDAGRNLGWNFAGGLADAGVNSMGGGVIGGDGVRVARLRDLASWSNWPITPAGKRWSRLGVSELLVVQTPLTPAEPGRVLCVEYGVQRDQPVFSRAEAMVASAVMGVLRERALLAFGTESTSMNNRVTKREQEILEQLTLGRTVRDIADVLNRSPHTVHDHVKSLHRKLNASSRGELIARYLGHIETCGGRTRRHSARRPDMVNGGAAAVRVNPVTVGPDNGTNVASEQHVPDLRFDT
jgi:DNA-binding CsgD family transcriptional regulator